MIQNRCNPDQPRTISPGDRFGHLVVLAEEQERTKNGARKFLCRCDCGELTSVVKYSLLNGNTRSCGCMQGAGSSRRALPMPKAGTRFGSLTVIGEAPRKIRIIHEKRKDGSIRNYEYHERMILCRCDCGNTKTVSFSNLRGGQVKSCGCLDKQHRESFFVHGATVGNHSTRLYRIWQGIRQRCLKTYSPEWDDYGGRGITVCDEWESSFEAFRTWALSHGYKDDLTIERIDNNDGYPENCRWATIQEQALNKRSNIKVIIGGQCKTVSQWSSITGISQHTIYSRIKKGWKPELACLTPLLRNRTCITIGDTSDSLTGWARRLNVSRDLIKHQAARSGQSIEETISGILTDGADKRRGRKITIDGYSLTISEWARKTGNIETMIRQRLFNGWPEKEAILTPSGGRRI